MKRDGPALVSDHAAEVIPGPDRTGCPAGDHAGMQTCFDDVESVLAVLVKKKSEPRLIAGEGFGQQPRPISARQACELAQPVEERTYRIVKVDESNG